MSKVTDQPMLTARARVRRTAFFAGVMIIGGTAAWWLGWVSQNANGTGVMWSPISGEPDPLRNHDDASTQDWLSHGVFATDFNLQPLTEEPLGMQPPQEAEHVFRFRREHQGMRDEVSVWRIPDDDIRQTMTHYQQQAGQVNWQPSDRPHDTRESTTVLHFQPENNNEDPRTLTIGLQLRGSTIHATICLRTPTAVTDQSSRSHP